MSTTARTDTLQSWLTGQRRHVLGILEGLDDADLRRPVLPSGWSCLDMIKHLTYDEEIFWFRAVVAGEQEAIDCWKRRRRKHRGRSPTPFRRPMCWPTIALRSNGRMRSLPRQPWTRLLRGGRETCSVRGAFATCRRSCCI